MSQTIAVEKSSNYILKPLLKVKRYPMDFSEEPYIQRPCNKKDCAVKVWNYFDEKNFMILNVITQELLNKHYKNDVPKDHFDARVLHWVKCRRHKLDDHRWPIDIEFLQMLDGTYDRELYNKQNYREKLQQSIFENCNYNITITENDLFMNYPFLQKYNSRQLCDLIENTSSFRFAPASFDVKCLKQKAMYKPNSSVFKDWSYSYGFYSFSPIEQRVKDFNYFNLFDVSVIPIKRSKHSVPRILERRYRIMFNSPIAKCFANNALFLNNIYMPIVVFDLSTYAQLIYRRFVLPVFKTNVFSLALNDLINYLGIRNKDKSHVKIRVMNALEELKTSELIKEYKSVTPKRNRTDWTTIQIVKHSGSKK